MKFLKILSQKDQKYFVSTSQSLDGQWVNKKTLREEAPHLISEYKKYKRHLDNPNEILDVRFGKITPEFLVTTFGSDKPRWISYGVLRSRNKQLYEEYKQTHYVPFSDKHQDKNSFSQHIDVDLSNEPSTYDIFKEYEPDIFVQQPPIIDLDFDEIVISGVVTQHCEYGGNRYVVITHTCSEQTEYIDYQTFSLSYPYQLLQFYERQVLGSCGCEEDPSKYCGGSSNE